MKWTRVSRAMLPAYKSFVDVFLNCRYSRFFRFTVEPGTQWREFGRDTDDRFFKSYYVFLRLSMSLYCRYNIHVDDKPGKRHRWGNIEYSINGANRRDYGLDQKQVISLVNLDSKRCDLIQVADLILGALVTTATAPAKMELSRHVHERIRRDGRKLAHREWTPSMRVRAT
jgi:hypothetical protein